MAYSRKRGRKPLAKNRNKGKPPIKIGKAIKLAPKAVTQVKRIVNTMAETKYFDTASINTSSGS